MLDRLIWRRHKGICVDNLFTGTFENIQPLLSHPSFRFIQQDVRDPLKVFGSVKDEPITVYGDASQTRSFCFRQ